MIHRRGSHGFTLVEMLLSMGIITLLAGISLPIYISFETRNDLEVTSQSIVEMLRRAQTYARSVNGDSQWGVSVQSGTATLFKGATYATRDATYDETNTSGLSSSGLSEIAFTKFDATPSTTGTITLTASNNETRTITINAKGMVSY